MRVDVDVPDQRALRGVLFPFLVWCRYDADTVQNAVVCWQGVFTNDEMELRCVEAGNLGGCRFGMMLTEAWWRGSLILTISS